MTRFQVCVLGLIEIAVGLAKIVSLGRWIPRWDMWWCVHATLVNLTMKKTLSEAEDEDADLEECS